MEKQCYIFLILIGFFLPISTQAIVVSANSFSTDSSEFILILSKHNGKRSYTATVGSKVRFTTKDARKQQKGLIQAIGADHFMINGISYPIDQIEKIKIRSDKGNTGLKITWGVMSLASLYALTAGTSTENPYGIGDFRGNRAVIPAVASAGFLTLLFLKHSRKLGKKWKLKVVKHEDVKQ